jgi:hypothetical protein
MTFYIEIREWVPGYIFGVILTTLTWIFVYYLQSGFIGW